MATQFPMEYKGYTFEQVNTKYSYYKIYKRQKFVGTANNYIHAIQRIENGDFS